jgi:hypothetical protein
MPIANDPLHQSLMRSSIVPADTTDTLGVIKASPTSVNFIPADITITDPGVSTIVHDTRQAEATTVLTYAEGSSWTVDYYSQILTKDSELSGMQITLNSVHQQYKKILNLELKVTQTLTGSQNQEDATMKVDGTATIVAGIVPSIGDMFTANIENAAKAVFRINTCSKKSIFKSAVYEVTYTLINDYKATVGILDKKVVSTYYYYKDYLIYGKDPLVLKEKHYILIRLHQAYKEILSYYFKKFLSNEFHTLIAQASVAVYDPHLTRFVLANFDTNEAPELQYIKALNLDEDRACFSDSVYTAILKRDKNVLLHSFTTAGLVSTSVFLTNPRFANIRYLGIEKIVYPVDPMGSVDSSILNSLKPTSMGSLTDPNYKEPTAKPSTSKLPQLIVPTNRPVDNLVDLYDVTFDSYYVFSGYFYKNNVEKMSTFERFVHNFLDKQNYDGSVLLKTALGQYKTWKPLEQFYILPILLVIIRCAMSEPDNVSVSSNTLDPYFLYVSESNGVDIDVDSYLSNLDIVQTDGAPFDFFAVYEASSKNGRLT